MIRQYQKEMDSLIAGLEGQPKKSLLLHACCAPCASYPLEYLQPYFDITVYFYNPNIASDEEYAHRYAELERYIKARFCGVQLINGSRDTEEFENITKGLENVPEGGARCAKCFKLRLRATAELAKKEDYDYFATTLTISPLKNPYLINGIGESLSAEYGVAYLASDFKKKDGFRRSTALCEEYGLYRQNFCGCEYSKRII